VTGMRRRWAGMRPLLVTGLRLRVKRGSATSAPPTGLVRECGVRSAAGTPIWVREGLTRRGRDRKGSVKTSVGLALPACLGPYFKGLTSIPLEHVSTSEAYPDTPSLVGGHDLGRRR
jgi:hypothetical protein